MHYLEIISNLVLFVLVLLSIVFIVMRAKILLYAYQKNNDKDLLSMGIDKSKPSRYLDWASLKRYADKAGDVYMIKSLKYFTLLQMGLADLLVVWLAYRVFLFWALK